MDRRKRRLLAALATLGTVGVVGCGSGSDRVADDFPPEIARVVVRNRDDDPHAVAVQLHEAADADAVRGREPLVDRTVTLDPTTEADDGDESRTEEWIADFDGRGDEFVLSYWLDGGQRQRYRTGHILSCTEITVEIGPDGEVAVSKGGTVDCYGGN